MYLAVLPRVVILTLEFALEPGELVKQVAALLLRASDQKGWVGSKNLSWCFCHQTQEYTLRMAGLSHLWAQSHVDSSSFMAPKTSEGISVN